TNNQRTQEAFTTKAQRAPRETQNPAKALLKRLIRFIARFSLPQQGPNQRLSVFRIYLRPKFFLRASVSLWLSAEVSVVISFFPFQAGFIHYPHLDRNERRDAFSFEIAINRFDGFLANLQRVLNHIRFED